jgi:hypothetical protein
MACESDDPLGVSMGALTAGQWVAMTAMKKADE